MKRSVLTLFALAGAASLLLAVSAQARISTAPSISAMSPHRGMVGQSVTIWGSGFSGLQVVQFDGIAAAKATVNGAGTKITVTVPPETTTGPGNVTVTTPGGTTTASASFTVLSAASSHGTTAAATSKPRILVVSPARARPGEKITIKGANLRGALWVRFGGVKAVYTVPSPTRIVATVPAGAQSGALRIATTLGTAGISFQVT